MPTVKEQIKDICSVFDSTTKTKVEALKSDIELAGNDSDAINALIDTFSSDLKSRENTMKSDIKAVLESA